MLWSALQATQLIDIDMELATGLKAVQDIFLISETSERDSEAAKYDDKECTEDNKAESNNSEEIKKSS